MNATPTDEKRGVLARMAPPLRAWTPAYSLARTSRSPSALESQLDTFERRSRGASSIAASVRTGQAAATRALLEAYWQELLANGGGVGLSIVVSLFMYATLTRAALVMSAASGIFSNGTVRGHLIDRGLGMALTPNAPKPARLNVGQVKRRQQASRTVDESFGPDVLNKATGLAVLPPTPWQSDAWWSGLEKPDRAARFAAKYAATYARHEAQAQRLTTLSLEQRVYAARASAAAAHSQQQARAASSSARPSAVQRLFVAATLTGAALVLGGVFGTLSSIIWVFPGAYLLFGLLTSRRPPDERAQRSARFHLDNEEASRGHADGHTRWAQRLSREADQQRQYLHEVSQLPAQLPQM